MCTLRNHRLLPLACSIASLLAAPAAFAQNPQERPGQPATLDEVQVTARKKTESIQDVPVTITAISTERLENNLTTDLGHVAELAPQVIIGRNTNGTGGFLTIRGISSSGTDAGLDQSVAVSVDGVPLSRGRVINSTVLDVAQVEVLSGPQALFFGKNSPAGAITLRTVDPTDAFEAYAKVGYEFNAKERYVESAISGPVSGNLSARLAVRGSWMDGWIENVAQDTPDPLHPGVVAPGAADTFGDLGPDGGNKTARVSFLYAPSDDFDVSLKITYDTQDMNSMNAYTELFCSGGQTVPTIAGIPFPYADCAKNQRKGETALPAIYAENWPYGNGGVPHYDSDFVLGALTFNKSFGNLTLTSTTGYYDQSIEGSNNADYTTFSLLWSSQQEDYDLLTQELRLTSSFDGPFNFMTGLYYETSGRTWFNAADIFHAGYNEMAQNWTTFETAADVDSKSYSGFLQLLWDFTPTLQLSAGARYSRDDKDGRFWNISTGVSSTPLYPAGQIVDVSFSDSNVSPEATLRWQPSKNHTIYGGYKSGYKSGGLSNGAILQSNASQDLLDFDSEESKGFEIGYKGTLASGTLRLDLTAYDYDYENLQVSTFDQATITFKIGNAAQAYTRGVTAAFEWLATDNLSFNGNLGYNRARYKEFRGVQCYAGQTPELGCVGGQQDLSGQPLVRAPNLTWNLGTSYRNYFDNGWKADLSAGVSFSSSYYAQPDNHPGGVQDSFWRANAAIHILPPNEQFRISFIGRNLNDAYYMIASSSAPGGPATQHMATFARPREMAVQFEYKWY